MRLSKTHLVSKVRNARLRHFDARLVYIYKMLRRSEDSSVAAEAPSAEFIKTSQPRSTRRDLLELVVAYILIMATIWTINPTQRILYWLPLSLVVAHPSAPPPG